MLQIDLAVASLYAAVGSVGNRRDAAQVLRPSRMGQCPLRLWKANQDGASVDPDPRRQWPALQGSYNEALIRGLLRLAGASVIDPPPGDDDTSWQDPDPILGVRPHVDGLIRWPAVGILNWAFLELKYLRATAHLSIAMNGLLSDRDYSWQTVTYLGTARQLMENYANAPQADPLWGDLLALNIVPKRSLFLSTAKDPSMTRMMFSQQTRPAKYETEEGRTLKGRKTKNGYVGGGVRDLTEHELTQIARRRDYLERYSQIGEQLDWYLEEIHFDAPDIQEIWRQVVLIPGMVQAPEPPLPIHDVMLPEEDLHIECAAYCEAKEWCYDLTLSRNLLTSIDMERFKLAPTPEPGAEPPGLR